MKFYSTNRQSDSVNFEQAIFRSFPKDKGLYFPSSLPELPDLWRSWPKEMIAYEIARRFTSDEIPEEHLEEIVASSIDFPLPLKRISDNIYALELFHGPTWAFKDVGARFLARCISFFVEKNGKRSTILVATSGDTGGAVAAGFHGVEGTEVVILFPRGKVSKLQQKQLTTWGGNVHALEVEGNFDDCQAMVKQAFLDREIASDLGLSSANSINIARLIPQSFYYFLAAQQLEDLSKLIIAVPSGNYGNLSAGLMAWKMGLPVKRFMAASNANDVVPQYLLTGQFKPKPSITTLANAMDIGNPSNFPRLLEIFDGNYERFKEMVGGYSLDNEGIRTAVKNCWESTQYLPDPHGAIAFQGLLQCLNKNETGIFLETAHPVKFEEVYLQMDIGLTQFEHLKSRWLDKHEKFQSIRNQYHELKDYLMAMI